MFVCFFGLVRTEHFSLGFLYSGLLSQGLIKPLQKTTVAKEYVNIWTLTHGYVEFYKVLLT